MATTKVRYRKPTAGRKLSMKKMTTRKGKAAKMAMPRSIRSRFALKI